MSNHCVKYELWVPKGFGGSEENVYIFSGSWGALVNFFQGFGEQAHSLRD